QLLQTGGVVRLDWFGKVVPNRCIQHAHGRSNAWQWRNDRGLHTQLVDKIRTMQWSGATERHQVTRTNINSALHTDLANTACHGRSDNLDYAFGAFLST